MDRWPPSTLGRERSVVRGDRGVDPRSALRARRRRWGEVRSGRIEFAEAVDVAVSRLPYDIRVPASRSSGAIRFGGAVAGVEQERGSALTVRQAGV